MMHGERKPATDTWPNLTEEVEYLFDNSKQKQITTEIIHCNTRTGYQKATLIVLTPIAVFTIMCYYMLYRTLIQNLSSAN